MYLELKENHPHGTKDYPFSEYHMNPHPHAFQIPVHWHDEAEIIYVRKGPLSLVIDGQEYIGADHSIHLVSPGELHLMSASEEPVDYFTLLFPLEFVSFQSKDWLENELLFPLRSHSMRFIPEITNAGLLKELVPLMEEIIEANHKDSYQKHLGVRILLLKFLELLAEHNGLRHDSPGNPKGIQKEILFYLQQNYCNHISLKDLASHFHLSEKYVSRFFKEQFHLTVTQYISYLRLSHAKHLLESTNLSVTDIALTCGFTNVSYFIRSFGRTYGLSPLQYRKRE